MAPGAGGEVSGRAGLKTEVGAELERAVDMLEGGNLGAPLLDEGHVEQRTVT